MKTLARWMWWCCAILIVVAMAVPVSAQDTGETEEEDVGIGTLMVEIEGWFAQASGLAYRPATVSDPVDPFGSEVIEFNESTQSEIRYRAGYGFRDNIGEFVVTYFSHEDEGSIERLNAGSFIYGETTTVPFEQGVNRDGLADGVTSEADTVLRDFRLDFYRDAFQTKRASGRWFIGYRRVEQQRRLRSEYFALAANLPPLIPPLLNSERADLVPASDIGSIKSNYTGRGVEGGFDLIFPIKGTRFWVESGIALAVLRGKADTEFASATHFYAMIQNGVISEILNPPYEEFEQRESNGTPVVNSIQQIEAQNGLSIQSDNLSSQVLETYLGIRFKAWRTLEVSVGFRNTRYDDVGIDVRSQQVVPDQDLTIDEVTREGLGILRLNTTALEETPKSVDYEGFYVGVAFRY